MPRPPDKRVKKIPASRSASPRNPKVAAVFSSYPEPIKSRLLALRRLILETAQTTEGVGALEEALKWGQVSYRTTESKSGSTIRIDQIKSEIRPAANQYAIFFHCQTSLVETFRELYPELSYSGNRAILLSAAEKLPEASLRHCIALALTYHRSKRKSGAK
jgi:hypothetical protein